MKELAEDLKIERLRRGLTLKEVSEKGGISISLLKALEEGKFEKFGNPMIVQGLLSDYCLVLGIDPVERRAVGREGRAGDQQNENEPGVSRKELHKGIIAGVLLVAIIVLSSAAGLWFMKHKSGQPDSLSQTTQTSSGEEPVSDLSNEKTMAPDPKQDKGIPPVSEVSQISPVPIQPDEIRQADSKSLMARTPREQELAEGSLKESNVSLGPEENEIVPKSNEERQSSALHSRGKEENREAVLSRQRPQEEFISGPVVEKGGQKKDFTLEEQHRFEIVADQKTWVQVRIDDKVTESNLLQPGEKREWKAKQNIRVTVGNGGGVRMKWDGKPLVMPGKVGRVMRFMLPESG